MQGDFEMVAGDAGTVYRSGDQGGADEGIRKPRRTFYENITHLSTNQDSQQRSSYAVVLLFELYRTLVASLLLVFTPQMCGEHACSYRDNMSIDDIPSKIQKNLYIAGLFFNYATLAAFIGLYFVEVIREERLLRYLECNPKVKSDNETCGKVLAMLPGRELYELRESQKAYFGFGIAVAILFVTNSVLSAIILAQYSAGSITVSTFVTNVLFMFTKIATLFTNTMAPENVLYSAYLTQMVQYNALDPDEIEHDKMVSKFIHGASSRKMGEETAM